MERKTVKIYIAAGAALLFAALFSFGLPGILFRWQDKKLEGQIGQEKADRVVITEQPELTIVEKVRLACRESSYSMILEKGRNYDQETIGERAGEELAELGKRGIVNETEPELAAYVMAPQFVMDVEGEDSVILWEGQVYTENGMEYELLLDDETGRILSLRCYEGISLESEQQEQLVYSWGDYLGCHVASVRETEIAESSELSWKESEKFENEVQMQVEDGIPESEARADVSESWGLEKSGFSARICYGDESGWEMVYQIEYIPFSGGSLTIMAE